MAELQKIDVYDISISGNYRVEAKNSTDAINKAKEWVEDNSGKLDYNWVLQEVYVEAPEE